MRDLIGSLGGWRRVKYGLMAVLACCLSWAIAPALATQYSEAAVTHLFAKAETLVCPGIPFHPSAFILLPCGTQSPPLELAPGQSIASVLLTQSPLEQGQSLYEAGRYAEAIEVLRQAVAIAPTLGEKVAALRNLALVYHHLGQWEQANDTLALALAELSQAADGPEQLALLAPVLDVQGSVQLAQGQTTAAAHTWEQAATLHRQLGHTEALLKTQINQAQALQRLGFHRQVVATLAPVVEALTTQPPTLERAIAQRTLADSLLQVGEITQAQALLEDSLAMTTALGAATATRTLSLSLGNVLNAQDETAAALDAYLQAETAPATPETILQAQLNRLAIYVKTGQRSAAQALWPTILSGLAAQPPSYTSLAARINLAQTLISLNPTPLNPTPLNPTPLNSNQDPTPRQIADILAIAVQQAQTLGDARLESYARGTLGHLYEQQGQWAEAQTLSEQALALALAQNAQDVAYRWEWQLGRIAKAQGHPEQAIAAYSDAVTTLQALRTDLVAVNPAAQVSFQENVEPIHRELVDLLLSPAQNDPNPAHLEQARQTVESLQLAELDNFFREACLNATAVNIDNLDQQAAVLYPIILRDRLEVIVRLPGQPLRHYASPIDPAEFDQTVSQLQEYLVLRVGKDYLPFAQQLYDWMIRPVAAELANSGAKTLVFVLDDVLRNLPMAALHDGHQFLIEQYGIALTPGLQLLNPKPIQSQALKVLTAGLSVSRQGFSALPNVVSEIETIESTVPTQVLLNDGFTVTALEQSLSRDSTPIVHLASHGKFSSDRDDTFVLTWDDRLDIDALNNLLQTSELKQSGPIELLVLSACQTATGDKLAALGLAGMAVRSGARSTIATLWQVNDEATALLMSKLYTVLSEQKTTKAEALRQAQLTVLREPRFRQHPYFWAPFVLLGNWL